MILRWNFVAMCSRTGVMPVVPIPAVAGKRRNRKTRMVQLPATAAIEYVAAGHFFPGGLLDGGTFGRGDFCPGMLLSGGLLPGGLLSGGLCPFPQFQCI